MLEVYALQERAAAPGVLLDQHRQVRGGFGLQLAQNWGLICDPAGVAELEDAFAVVNSGDVGGSAAKPRSMNSVTFRSRVLFLYLRGQ